MTPARFRWGLLLMLFGTLILLRNFDCLNYNFWIDFLFYFPFFLIAVGIEKIFTGSRLQFISYLTSVALVCGALYVALEGSRDGSQASFFSKSTFVQEADSSVENLRAVLRLDGGDLTVRDATGNMVYGRFREFTRKPDIRYYMEDHGANIVLTSRSGRFLGGVVKIEGDEPDDWYLSFSKDVPLFLECYGDHSDIHLNLSTTPLHKLRVEADEGNIYLKLGDLIPEIDVSVVGDDSRLRLRVPSNAGLRISGADHARYLTRLGLIERNGYFINEGFDTLRNRILVDLDNRFRSLSIDSY